MSFPSTSIDPFEGRSSPAIRLSSVLFPEPEGPISASNDPSGTSRSRFSSTLTGSFPLQNVLAMPRSRTIALGSAAGVR